MNRIHRPGTGLLLTVWFMAALLPVAVLGFTGGFAYLVPFHAAARISAVTAFAILFLQPVIAARFKWIERSAGLDRLLTFHRISGAAAAVLALLHPVLLALGSRSTAILFSADPPWQIALGKITIILLYLFGAAALFHRFLRIPFQQWFRAHNGMTPVILALIFIHSWFTGVKYLAGPVKTVWICFLAAGIYSYLHLTLYQRLRSRSKPYSVTNVRSVTGGVWEITLSPPSGSSVFPFLPGQFLFVTLLRGRGLPAEEHPFTISSAPGSDSISITVKELGDYTRSAGRTKAGDRAAVMAPYGRFSYLLYPLKKRIVFIAGGIGITPVISMIRHMKSANRQAEAVLLYGNRTESDIAFRLELDLISQGTGPFTLQTVNILSRPDDTWKGKRGRIGSEMIRKHLGSLDDCTFFICGPPGMLGGASAALLLLGVNSREIHMERFSL